MAGVDGMVSYDEAVAKFDADLTEADFAEIAGVDALVSFDEAVAALTDDAEDEAEVVVEEWDGADQPPVTLFEILL